MSLSGLAFYKTKITEIFAIIWPKNEGYNMS